MGYVTVILSARFSALLQHFIQPCFSSPTTWVLPTSTSFYVQLTFLPTTLLRSTRRHVAALRLLATLSPYTYVLLSSMVCASCREHVCCGSRRRQFDHMSRSNQQLGSPSSHFIDHLCVAWRESSRRTASSSLEAHSERSIQVVAQYWILAALGEIP